MSKVLSVKLDEEKLKIIDEIAKEEKSDRSSVTRKLLELGIKQWMIEKAIQLVLSGKVSVWKAAQIAQISLREFRDILHCLLYTSPSPRDLSTSRMPSSA